MGNILTYVLDGLATLVLVGVAWFFIGLSWQSNTEVWKEHIILGSVIAFLIWRIWV